jgi:hypothetical protein
MEHFATDDTISELSNVLGLVEAEDDPEEAKRRLRDLLAELRRNALPEDDREPIAPGDYRYYAPGQVVRVIPERIVDDRPGCTCYSYAEGGPHDPSCALEA